MPQELSIPDGQADVAVTVGVDTLSETGSKPDVSPSIIWGSENMTFLKCDRYNVFFRSGNSDWPSYTTKI